MADLDRDLCRKAAAECVELARVTSDPQKKEVLLMRAQEWLKLAYARHDAEFRRLVGELNSEQMGFRYQGKGAQQQQPTQQQQSRQKPDES